MKKYQIKDQHLINYPVIYLFFFFRNAMFTPLFPFADMSKTLAITFFFYQTIKIIHHLHP